MDMNRREFNGHLSRGGAAIILFGSTGSAIMLGGCTVTTEEVVQDIENWVPVGVNAFNSILALLQSNGFVPSTEVTLIIDGIEASLNMIEAACQKYLAITPPPAGALQEIEGLVSSLAASFGSFLQQLNIPNAGLFNLIVSLVQVIISTVEGFLNQIPVAAGAAKTMRLSTSVRVGTAIVSIVPQPRTKRKFKVDWNDAVTRANSGLVCPPTAYLKLTTGERVADFFHL